MPCQCRRGTGPHDHVVDGVFATGGGSVGQLLNQHIVANQVQVWNSKQSAIEAFECALSPTSPSSSRCLSSDADAELLIHIPFNEILRIRGVVVQGTNDSYAPALCKLLCNRGEIHGFDSVERLQPDEVLTLANTSASDAVVYRINPIKFQNVECLTMFFTESFGEDETRVAYIQFYGESTGQPRERQLATNVVYEAMANPADHKILESGAKPMHAVS